MAVPKACWNVVTPSRCGWARRTDVRQGRHPGKGQGGGLRVQVRVHAPSHAVAIHGGAATPCVQIPWITDGSGPVLAQRRVGTRPRGTACRCVCVKCVPMNQAALASVGPSDDSAMAVASAAAALCLCKRRNKPTRRLGHSKHPGNEGKTEACLRRAHQVLDTGRWTQRRGLLRPRRRGHYSARQRLREVEEEARLGRLAAAMLGLRGRRRRRGRASSACHLAPRPVFPQRRRASRRHCKRNSPASRSGAGKVRPIGAERGRRRLWCVGAYHRVRRPWTMKQRRRCSLLVHRACRLVAETGRRQLGDIAA